MTQDRDTELPNYWLWILSVLGAVLLVFAALAGVVLYLFGDVTADRMAALGDSFGWITSLFTALAFAFVILALIIQMQEMRLTWQEIEASRRAQEKMAEQAFNSSAISIIDNLVAIDSRLAIDFVHARVDGNYMAAALDQSLNKYAMQGMLRRLVQMNPDAPDELKQLASFHHGEDQAELLGAIFQLGSMCHDCRSFLECRRKVGYTGPVSKLEVDLYRSIHISSVLVLEAFANEDGPIPGFQAGEPGSGRRYKLSPGLRKVMETIEKDRSLLEILMADPGNAERARLNRLAEQLLDEATVFVLDVLGYYRKRAPKAGT